MARSDNVRSVRSHRQERGRRSGLSILRREGPHRFTQKQPRTFVSILASIAAVETSKHSLSRDHRERGFPLVASDTRHSKYRTSGLGTDLAPIQWEIEAVIWRQVREVRLRFREIQFNRECTLVLL